MSLPDSVDGSADPLKERLRTELETYANSPEFRGMTTALVESLLVEFERRQERNREKFVTLIERQLRATMEGFALRRIYHAIDETRLARESGGIKGRLDGLATFIFGGKR
jgi:hypothetical protein